MKTKIIWVEQTLENSYYFVTEQGSVYKVDNSRHQIRWRLKTIKGRPVIIDPINFAEQNGILYVAERTQIGSNISAIISTMKIDERGVLLEENTILNEPFHGAGISEMNLDNGKLYLSSSFLNTFAEYSLDDANLVVTNSFSGDGNYEDFTNKRNVKFILIVNKLKWIEEFGYDLSGLIK